MKKAISLLLALVLCLSLCACGATSKKVMLTKDNIEKYFKVHAYIEEAIGHNFKEDFIAVAKLEGVSQNFNYEDISVTFKIQRTAKCDTNHKVPCEVELTVTTDVAGTGSSSIPLWAGDMTVERHNHPIAFPDGWRSTWEIVSVSGYLEPAG